jgi:hypothetical protein
MNARSSSLDSRRKLWFGIASCPAVWAAHGLTSVVVTTLCCQHELGATARGVVLGFTAGALLFTVSAVVTGASAWRALTRAAGPTPTEFDEQTQTLALLSVLMGIAFTLGVLWTGLPAVLIADICEVVR